MPATARRARGRRSSPAPEVLPSGPFKGVKNTTDPFDDTSEYLVDAVNMYIPDAEAGSGIYARPGEVLMNPVGQLGVSSHMGQGIYHETFNGVDYNFECVSGKLYRVSADQTTYTDVTPVGVTITAGLSSRVFMLEFAGYLIVSDGVNRPWIGSNLASTPITGTNIQYDSGNSAWCAQHMTLYSGALVFVVKTIAGISHQTRIIWSAPFDPTQGYFNTVSSVAVDYTWDLVQTGSAPIYAIQGTNVALFYWRDYSIGALTGPIGATFKNDATHDAIDFKIGTRAPATIALHGNTIFFCDTEGRPQMLPIGNRIVPIWKEMRSQVESARTDVATATQLTACGAVFSPLNLYVAAIWSTVPTTALAPATLFVFDVLTGQYVGRWIIGPGINIEAIGVLKDQNGEPSLVVIGPKVVAINNGFGGYVWRMTNPQENIWTDNGVLPLILAQTARLGFAADVVRYADKAVAITGSTAPVALSLLSASQLEQSFMTDVLETADLSNALMTADGANVLAAEGIQQATATPYAASLDGTYRCVWGTDIEGRGFNATLSPTTALSQWRLHKFELTTVTSMAPPEEA